jgi:hypothetical protein
VSAPFLVPITACVTGLEQSVVQGAAKHLAAALSQASSAAWQCEPVFVPDLDALAVTSADRILIVSLQTELATLDLPWPEHEKRLRTTFAALCQNRGPIFICTILRHVDGNDPQASARLVRIRRLNLLAAEISRESGALVLDLDRTLSHIGAQRLDTDYRLAGKEVPEIAGHFIALTLIDTAMDALCSFEVQDAAKDILNGSHPIIAKLDQSKPEVTLRKNIMSMGQGRKKQSVSPVAFSTQGNYVGWLVRQILRGAISPMEALRRLSNAVRRRGVREAAILLGVGLVRQLQSKK